MERRTNLYPDTYWVINSDMAADELYREEFINQIKSQLAKPHNQDRNIEFRMLDTKTKKLFCLYDKKICFGLDIGKLNNDDDSHTLLRIWAAEQKTRQSPSFFMANVVNKKEFIRMSLNVDPITKCFGWEKIKEEQPTGRI
jgi:hypothetical protein